MIDIASPLVLPNGQTLPNRLAKAAMTEGLADAAGRPTEGLCCLYERWSAGGAGLLITGNTAIDREHLERAGNVVLDASLGSAGRTGLAALARAAKSGGSRAWVQISHAGRQTPNTINPHPSAPSAVPMRRMPLISFGDPRAMTGPEVVDTADRFVDAARMVEDAGFDGVQLHAAHGYLLSEFLSPVANRRSDQWGGDLEARARLLLTIVERVKASTAPSFSVSVKLNSADFQRGGFDIDDSAAVAGWLDAAGVDLIEISGGTYEAARMMGEPAPRNRAQRSTFEREAYFLRFAPQIRAALPRAKLMVTGGFRAVALMNEALARGDVDVIGLARPLLVDPEACGALLGGRRDLPRVEDRLRLGPGLLAPHSPFKIIKALNAGATQAWYYEQMDRLGAGLDPDKGRHILGAARAYLRRDARKREALAAAHGDLD